MRRELCAHGEVAAATALAADSDEELDMDMGAVVAEASGSGGRARTCAVRGCQWRRGLFFGWAYPMGS